jgi:hypothetical protein
MQFENIHRHADGSIDYGFYHRAARKLRAEARTEHFKGRRGVVWPFIAVAVISAPLALAGIVHELNGGSANTARVSRMAEAVAPAINRNAQALVSSRAWWGNYGQRHVRSRDVAMANQ